MELIVCYKDSPANMTQDKGALYMLLPWHSTNLSHNGSRTPMVRFTNNPTCMVLESPVSALVTPVGCGLHHVLGLWQFGHQADSRSSVPRRITWLVSCNTFYGLYGYRSLGHCVSYSNVNNAALVPQCHTLTTAAITRSFPNHC